MSKEPIIGQNSDKLSEREKHFKVIALMAIGFMIKRKKLIYTVVVLGLITAFVLSYIVIY